MAVEVEVAGQRSQSLQLGVLPPAISAVSLYDMVDRAGTPELEADPCFIAAGRDANADVVEVVGVRGVEIPS
jgi:hypothetical protein